MWLLMFDCKLCSDLLKAAAMTWAANIGSKVVVSWFQPPVC